MCLWFFFFFLFFFFGVYSILIALGQGYNLVENIYVSLPWFQLFFFLSWFLENKGCQMTFWRPSIFCSEVIFVEYIARWGCNKVGSWSMTIMTQSAMHSTTVFIYLFAKEIVYFICFYNQNFSFCFLTRLLSRLFNLI